MPNFAANLSFLFQEHAFLARFDAAASLGFKAVEYLFPYAHEPADIKARLDANGLTQALFNASPGDWEAGERGLAALPGREDAFRAAIDQAARYAEALGCPKVHVMAGLVPDGADPAPYEETYIKNLQHAADTLGAHGVRALIEPLNNIDMPGYLLSGSAQACRIIDAVGSANLALQFDVYHLQIMEGDLARRMERLFERIGHIQIAGVPGRHEPDVGEINYPYLFETMDRLGYDGWVGCEYRPKDGTEAGIGWARAYGVGV